MTKIKSFICSDCNYEIKSKTEIYVCPSCNEVSMGKFENEELIEEITYSDGYYYLKIKEDEITLFLTVLDMVMEDLKKHGISS